MNKNVEIFLFGIILLISSFAEGVETSRELMSPRGVALGTALRGGVGLNESIYLNPAAISFTEAYSIEIGFHGIPDANSHRLLHASVVDTKSSHLGGGFAYYMDLPPSGMTQSVTHNVNLALSYMILTRVSLGVTGKYRSGLVDGDKWFDKTNADVGTLVEIVPQWHVGGVLYNILPHSEQESSAGVGTRVGLHPSIYLSGDAVKKFSISGLEGVSLHSGLEVLAAGGLVLRGGYSYAVKDEGQRLSFGGGWGGGKLSLFYASSLDLQGELPMEHSLAARIVF